MTILSNPRFLAVYSGVLTVAFSATVFFGVTHGVVFASTGKDSRSADFEQITVHRINVVEPDGTTRLVIANAAAFPGGFYKGKEFSRPDRKGASGFLFMNNEGTENGGLLFGGYKDPDGTVHSGGHLSFDEYEQDQALALDMQQDGTSRHAGYAINDNGSALITPEVMDAFNKAKALPTDTPEHRAAAKKAMDEVFAKYPIQLIPRAYLGRDRDTSASLRLRDAAGHDRIRLRVAPDGTPQMQFLDASGNVTNQWPQK